MRITCDNVKTVDIVPVLENNIIDVDNIKGQQSLHLRVHHREMYGLAGWHRAYSGSGFVWFLTCGLLR